MNHEYYRNIMIYDGVIYHDGQKIRVSDPHAKIDKLLAPSSNRPFVVVSHT